MLKYNELDPTKMYLAFHKGGKSDLKTKLVSSMCKVFTNSDYRKGKKEGINKVRYAHTELIFPKSIAGDKNSYSSRGTDDPSGVSFKEILYTNADRWDFVEIKWITLYEDILEAHKIATKFVGCKYAYSNVFNTFGFFRTRKDRHGMKDWWCSEIDAYAVSFGDYKLSPNALYTETIVRNMNHKGVR